VGAGVGLGLTDRMSEVRGKSGLEEMPYVGSSSTERRYFEGAKYNSKEIQLEGLN